MTEWGLGHLCAHIGKTGPGEPPEDGDMTLPCRHRIRNSSNGGRARYLSFTEAPHNTEYLRVSREETFVSLKHKYRSGGRTRDLRLSKQAACKPPPPGI